jgi:hypothetical protein
MKTLTLADLQASIQDKPAFSRLADYAVLCRAFLSLLRRQRPTRIVSPFQKFLVNDLWTLSAD